MPSTLSTASLEARKGLFQALTFPQTTDILTWDDSLIRGNQEEPRWTFAQIQRARTQPTVILAKSAVSATLLAAAWTTRTMPKDKWNKKDRTNYEESIVNEIEAYVTRFVLPHRSIMPNLVSGIFDYGYAPYEKVLAYDAESELVYIKTLKPLLQEYTEILVDSSGDFRGLRNRIPIQWTRLQMGSSRLQAGGDGSRLGLNSPSTSNRLDQYLYAPSTMNGELGWIDLDSEHAALFNLDVEGQNLYGRSLLANIISVDEDWRSTMADLRKYHGKIAGNRMILRYPRGTSKIGDQEYDNREIAIEMSKQLQQNNVVIMPIESSDALETALVGGSGDPAKGAWSIEGISGDISVNRSDYLSVLQYFDAQFCRGLTVPERAILEAQYGSKADAERHTASLEAILQAKLDQIIYQWNEQVVKPMITLNFGEKYVGLVTVDAAPITDAALEYLKQLYTEHLSTAAEAPTAQEELNSIDFQAIRDRIGVPTQLNPEAEIANAGASFGEEGLDDVGGSGADDYEGGDGGMDMPTFDEPVEELATV
jgi:hypothetical protein